MIRVFLLLIFLAIDFDDAKRIRSTLYDANRIISQCDEVDKRCKETVQHAKLFDDRGFRVRVQVSTVTTGKDGLVVVNGTIRPAKRDLNEYRTEQEKQRIAKSIKSKRQNVGQDSDWIRRRNKVHRDMMKELDRLAKQRRRKVEYIEVTFRTDKYEATQLAGQARLQLLARIDDFEIRKGVPAIRMPPAIGKLTGTIHHADIDDAADTVDAGDIPASTAAP